MNYKYILHSALVATGICTVVAIVLLIDRVSQDSIVKYLPPTIATPLVATSTPQVESSNTKKVKQYINSDFGIEFSYPIDWEIHKKSFGGNYTVFNVIATPSIGELGEPPFLVNIVLPEFADRTFLRVSAATSTVTVDGISGVKYVYMFENNPETAIVVPFGQYKMILGTRAPYEKDYYQILSTFKFLK